MEAEEKTLATLHTISGPDIWPPVLDQLKVDAGFEAALGVVLGDDLAVPADEGAPVHWRSLPAYPCPAQLPAETKPLSDYVKAPAALARRLSQIGVVENTTRGEALHVELAQGQRLVSLDGAMWRWDGFTVSANASTVAATVLAQRNRLTELRNEIKSAKAEAKAVRERYLAAQDRTQKAARAEKDALAAVAGMITALNEARDRHGKLQQKAFADASRVAALEAEAARLDSDLVEVEAQRRAAETAAADLLDDDTARDRLDQQRASLATHRTELEASQRAFDQLLRDAASRRDRIGEFEAGLASWRERSDDADAQLAQLVDREQAARDELTRLDARPREITELRATLLDRTGKAELGRNEAADRLARAEAELAELDRQLKGAEANLSEAREERVRAEAAVEQAMTIRDTIDERIADRLDCTPGELLEVAEVKAEKIHPDLMALEAKLERAQPRAREYGTGQPTGRRGIEGSVPADRNAAI